jgi:hypothetical protein
MKTGRISSVDERRSVKQRLLIFLSVIVAIGFVYLFIDYRGPGIISLRNDVAFGFPCLRAGDLVVQEYDKSDNLWATRGMIIYQLKKDENKFVRIAHIPTGFSVLWLRNFTLFRRLTIRPECVEMIANDNGDICALSAGRIWLLKNGENKFRETFRLVNYGFGDQGIRNDGILNADDSVVYFGEYFQNPDRNKVDLFKSRNKMSSWEVAYRFQPKLIRHIHAIQKDPYSDKLWVCTGDDDEESMIAWSDDEFKTIRKIGQGRQMWRVCQLIFTEDDVIWGTDNGSGTDAGIYRWDKETAEIHKYQNIDGAVFYATRLKNGTIVMSTDREGLNIEKDDKTRLYIISGDNKLTSIECGTWNHKMPGFWFKYALLRFQRNQGAGSLAVTCMNQKEFPDSELIIISEESLRKDKRISNEINK